MTKTLTSIAVQLQGEVVKYDKLVCARQKLFLSKTKELKEKLLDFVGRKEISKEIENAK